VAMILQGYGAGATSEHLLCPWLCRQRPASVLKVGAADDCVAASESAVTNATAPAGAYVPGPLTSQRRDRQ